MTARCLAPIWLSHPLIRPGEFRPTNGGSQLQLVYRFELRDTGYGDLRIGDLTI